MDQKYNTSFIPKKFLTENVDGGGSSRFVKRRSVIGPGYFLSLLIFLIALVVSGAVFGYTKITQKNIDDKLHQLEGKMKTLDNALIDDFERLDNRMKTANTLIAAHLAPTALLTFLENVTMTDVRYLKLSYDTDSYENTIRGFIAGVSDDYESVALQMDQYRNAQTVNNPVIINLRRGEIENVNEKAFEIQFAVDPHSIGFGSTLAPQQ